MRDFNISLNTICVTVGLLLMVAAIPARAEAEDTQLTRDSAIKGQGFQQATAPVTLAGQQFDAVLLAKQQAGEKSVLWKVPKGANYFEALVGAVEGCTSDSNLKIYVVMGKNNKMQQLKPAASRLTPLKIAITGASTLKLVTTNKCVAIANPVLKGGAASADRLSRSTRGLAPNRLVRNPLAPPPTANLPVQTLLICWMRPWPTSGTRASSAQGPNWSTC